MAAWVAAGQPLAHFWDATGHEMAAAIQGEEERLKAMRDVAVVGGWIGGITGRLERIPPLDDMLAMFRPRLPEAPMSNEQMLLAWSGFAATCPGMVTQTFEPFDEEVPDHEPERDGKNRGPGGD